MNTTVIGYVRQSSRSASQDDQRLELEAAACGRIVTEKVKRRGISFEQRALLLKQVQPGTILVVTSLDRLGSSLDDLTAFLELLFQAGGHLRSLGDGFDTGARLGGSLKAFEALAAAAKIYRSERTKDSMAASRARGNQLGRSWALSPERWPEMKAMIGTAPVKDILAHFGISKQSFYNYRKAMEDQETPVPVRAKGSSSVKNRLGG